MTARWRVAGLLTQVCLLLHTTHSARPDDVSIGSFTLEGEGHQQPQHLEAVRQETIRALEHNYELMVARMDADKSRAAWLQVQLQDAKQRDADLATKTKQLQTQRGQTHSTGVPDGKSAQSLLQTNGFNLEDFATVQLEAQLNMLNEQRSQVQMQMHHVERELKKLQESMAVNKIIAPAMKKQIEKLKSGKDAAIKAFLDAMQEASRIGMLGVSQTQNVQMGSQLKLSSFLSLDTATSDDQERRPVDLSTRKSVIYGQNLEVTLSTLEENFQRIQEQILADKQRVEILKSQMKEDKRMDAALKAQIERIQEGREETINGLQGAMVNAHKTGNEKMKEGLKGLIQLTEEHIVSSKETANLGPYPPGAQGTYENGIWRPLEAKSAELERELVALQQQREKVGVQIISNDMEIKKLEENISVNEAVSSAMEKQIQVLKSGRKDAILAEFQTMAGAAEAMSSATAKSDSNCSECSSHLQKEEVDRPLSLIELQQDEDHHEASQDLSSTGYGSNSLAILGEELVANLATLQQHCSKVVAQISADARRMQQLQTQLDEDKRVDESLKMQIEQIQAGRKHLMQGLQGSMTRASLDGQEALEANIRSLQHGSVLMQESERDTVQEQPLAADASSPHTLEALEAKREQLRTVKEQAEAELRALSEDIMSNVVAERALKAHIEQAAEVKHIHPLGQKHKVQDASEGATAASVMQVADGPDSYPAVNIWGYDGLEGRSDLMMRRVGELEKQLDRVTSQIGWEKIQEARLKASIKEHTRDQQAIKTEAEQLRRYRTETEQGLRDVEIEASQAGQKAASGGGGNDTVDESVTPKETSSEDTNSSETVSVLEDNNLMGLSSSYPEVQPYGGQYAQEAQDNQPDLSALQQRDDGSQPSFQEGQDPSQPPDQPFLPQEAAPFWDAGEVSLAQAK